MEHLDAITALLWSEGELDAQTASRWHRHVTLCGACRAQIAALERENRWLRSCMQDAPQAAAARPRLAFAAGLAAAGLAIAGALAVWLTLLQPWINNTSRMGYGGQNLISTLLFSAMFWHGWGSLTHTIEVLGPLAFFACAWMLLRPRRAHWPRSVLGLVLFVLLVPLAGHAWSAPRRVRKAAAPGRVVKIAAPRPPLHPARSAVKPASPATAPVQVMQVPMRIHGQSFFTILAGMTVPHDLIVHAQNVRIDGVIQGNLISLAQDVTIDGQVTGDVIVFAATLHIDRGANIGGDVAAFVHEVRLAGQVHGNYFGGNQQADISGQIHGSVLTWNQQLNLQPDAEIGGSLISGGQIMDIEGTVHQNVLAASQTSFLNGAVNGKFEVRGGHLNVGSVAKAGGPVIFHGKYKPSVQAGAQLAQGLHFESLQAKRRWRHAHFYIFQALIWAAALVAGAVLWLLFPGFFRAVERQQERVGASLGTGAVLLIATPILAIFIAITLVGLPLALAALGLYLLAIYLATIVVAHWLGNLLLGKTAGFWEFLLRLAVGLLIIRIAYQIPFAGGLVLLAILVWGLGLQALAAYELLRAPRPAVA